MDRYYSEGSAYIYTKNIGVTGRTRGEHGTDGRDEHKKVLSCYNHNRDSGRGVLRDL